MQVLRLRCASLRMPNQELPQPSELGAVAAVEEVNDQADGQPGEKTEPCDYFKPHHEYYAKDDAQHREDRAQRSAEAAVAIRLALAQDEHTDGDQEEGEEGTDVGEIGDGADVQKAGGNAYHKPRYPGGHGRGAELGVDAAEDGRQQAVAGHGEPDARLAKLEDENGGDHAQNSANQDKEPHPDEARAAGHQGEPLEGVDHRGCIAHDRLPGHDAAEHNGHRAVEHSAGYQRGQNAEGQVALRVLALFGRRGDRVEADVGEEDDRAAGKHAGPAVGHEGMPVMRLDKAGAGKDEDQDGGDLDEH